MRGRRPGSRARGCARRRPTAARHARPTASRCPWDGRRPRAALQAEHATTHRAPRRDDRPRLHARLGRHARGTHDDPSRPACCRLPGRPSLSSCSDALETGRRPQRTRPGWSHRCPGRDRCCGPPSWASPSRRTGGGRSSVGPDPRAGTTRRRHRAHPGQHARLPLRRGRRRQSRIGPRCHGMHRSSPHSSAQSHGPAATSLRAHDPGTPHRHLRPRRGASGRLMKSPLLSFLGAPMISCRWVPTACPAVVGTQKRGHRGVAPLLEGLFGGDLLSHTVSRAVPSALKGLASGFGMEPGVSPSL